MKVQEFGPNVGIITLPDAFWFVFCVTVPCEAVPVPVIETTPTTEVAVAHGAGQFWPIPGELQNIAIRNANTLERPNWETHGRFPPAIRALLL